MSATAVLATLERYYDAVPRHSADTVGIGPFTLFVARAGWPYYARPTLGATTRPTVKDVGRVLARQRELDLPQKLEWVDENAPGLADSATAAGMHVERCPLLVLDGNPKGRAGSARMLDAGEIELIRLTQGAVSVGFANPGTSTGTAGGEERDAAAAALPATILDALLERIAGGFYRSAAVFAPDSPAGGPVGGGGYSPVDGVAELTGVAVLPGFRRRGLGAMLTFVLATDALSGDVTTVFCSAESAAVANIYEGIGFRRVGTACIASADRGHP